MRACDRPAVSVLCTVYRWGGCVQRVAAHNPRHHRARNNRTGRTFEYTTNMNCQGFPRVCTHTELCVCVYVVYELHYIAIIAKISIRKRDHTRGDRRRATKMCVARAVSYMHAHKMCVYGVRVSHGLDKAHDCNIARARARPKGVVRRRRWVSRDLSLQITYIYYIAIERANVHAKP